MNNNGWIKLHRRIQKKAFYRKPYYLALWTHLLLSANHSGKEFMWNDAVITVASGQFITGRKQLSEDTGIPETTVERILSFFEKERQIGQQKTTKYRLITIRKWDEYQIVDNKRTTSGQQADTNKNDNNDNKQLGDESPKDMSWKKPYNENQHSDDEVVIDADSGEEVKPKEKEKKHYKEVYDIFEAILGKKPNNWLVNRTQMQCAENLYTERGVVQITKALQSYKEAKENLTEDILEFMPQITSPYDLDSKWSKLHQFIKKHGQ